MVLVVDPDADVDVVAAPGEVDEEVCEDEADEVGVERDGLIYSGISQQSVLVLMLIEQIKQPQSR